MIITNKTGSELKLKNASTGKFITLKVGKSEYPGVSVNNPAYRVRLEAMKEAGMIDYAEMVKKDKPKEDKDVRNTQAPTVKTVNNGSADRGDGSLPKPTKDKGK
jgi:hypothetical protein